MYGQVRRAGIGGESERGLQSGWSPGAVAADAWARGPAEGPGPSLARGEPREGVAIRAAEEPGAVESIFFLGGQRGIRVSSILFLLITGVRGWSERVPMGPH